MHVIRARVFYTCIGWGVNEKERRIYVLKEETGHGAREEWWRIDQRATVMPRPTTITHYHTTSSAVPYLQNYTEKLFATNDYLLSTEIYDTFINNKNKERKQRTVRNYKFQ